MHDTESAPDRAARFVLQNLRGRHGEQWLSGPRERRAVSGLEGSLGEMLSRLGFRLTLRQREKVSGLSSLQELFQYFFLRGVVLDAHEGLLGWLEGRYPLVARDDIPTPDQMLTIQCEGRRFVSLLFREEQQQSYGRHADACDFLLHDLEHAHKFFSCPDSQRGQVRFFRALKSSEPLFARWAGDALFNTDLNYLKSDMNSHPVHLMKYLKAIVLAAEIRRSGQRYPDLVDFWEEVFRLWQMPRETSTAALCLNQPELETVAHQVTIRDFFNRSADGLTVSTTCE